MVSTKSLPGFASVLLFAMTVSLPARQSFAAGATGQPQADGIPRLAPNYGMVPLSFEANQGQTDPQVRFLAHGEGYSLFLTDSEAVLALHGRGKCKTEGLASGLDPRSVKQAPCAAKQDVVRMKLAGALAAPRGQSASARAVGEEELAGKVNYFVGNDPAQWRSGLPTYARVRYTAVYPGVDLVYYGNQQQLEYDFVVAPGASPAAIRLAFPGQKKLRIGKDGDLVVLGANSDATFHKPVVYQADAGGQRRAVEGRFKLQAGNTVSFTLGAYDPARALVIDPVLTYSTYLGGSGYDTGSGVALDSLGNVYLTGATQSTNFPVVHPIQGTDKSKTYSTAFVAKLNADGTALVYSTYLGGTVEDIASGVAADSQGNAYVAGYTSSKDFPLSHPLQNKLKGSLNAFVAKINAAGSALVYSTYLGGTGNVQGAGDSASAIAVDSNGSAYVAGSACSADFPTTVNAFQPALKSTSGYSCNGFVTKFNAAGSALAYSTYLGGSGQGGYYGDSASAIAVDSAGNAYLAGSTNSLDFPAVNAFQGSLRSTSPVSSGNAFVTKLNPAGSTLVYSTYLGGSGSIDIGGDAAKAIAVDSSGKAYVTGQAKSPDFPLLNALQSTLRSPFYGNAFVTEFNAAGSGLVYSTYLGGSAPCVYICSGDMGNAIAVDSNGSAYVTGTTESPDFPTTRDAYQTTNGSLDLEQGFITKFSPQGDVLDYSTYFGGSGVGITQGAGIAVDSNGHVFLQGSTNSNDFPVTSGALQSTPGGGLDMYLSEFAFPLTTATTTTLTSSENPGNTGVPISFTATVTLNSGPGVASGSVRFTVDGKILATIGVNSQGQAVWNTNSLATGAHTVRAIFFGNPTEEASSASLTETIVILGVYPISGGGQNTVYGKPFANPLVVEVKDGSGNPVAGQSVTFTGTGLSFSPPTAVTGANGMAQSIATATQAGSLTGLVSFNTSTAAVFPLVASKAQLRVQPASVPAHYGQAIPSLTGFLITGFVNGDIQATAVTGAPALGTAATSGSPAGVYPITASAGTLASANYTFTFVPGYLQIYKAPLTATATSLTMKAGSAVPPLTYSLTGFVNGDMAGSAVTGAPMLSTTATSASKPGHYPITGTLGTLASANYYFVPVYGVMTVTP